MAIYGDPPPTYYKTWTDSNTSGMGNPNISVGSSSTPLPNVWTQQTVTYPNFPTTVQTPSQPLPFPSPIAPTRGPRDIAETDVNTIIADLEQTREQLQEVCSDVDATATADDRPMQRDLNNAVYYLDELIDSLKKAKGGSK